MAKLDVKKVERFSIEVPDEPGQGAQVLGAIAAGGADLIAAWGYPYGGEGSAKIEVIPADSAAFRAAAKKAKIKAKKECAAFCVTGRNKVGALADALSLLAAKGINVHAVQAIGVGSKFGALIEVASKDVRKAAGALGA